MNKQLPELELRAVVLEQMAAGNFPGAVVLVGHWQDTVFLEAFGNAVTEPLAVPMQTDTIFDVASLTKPVCTAASIMILADRGLIDIEDSASRYIPAFSVAGKDGVKIKHLLSHTSGMPPYLDIKALGFEVGKPQPEKLFEAVCAVRPHAKPAEQPLYICLGYVVLGRIVEIVSGQGLDAFAKENIFAPLGMDDTGFNPGDDCRHRLSATENRGGRFTPGTVHDPIASIMGGVSGNAGLFSTARDLAAFCRMLLSGGIANGMQILSGKAVTLLTMEAAFGRAYGFDVNSDSHSWIKGTGFGSKAFCHSGYTGTSIVCDPESGKFVIILTNRTHPTDTGTVKPLRMRIADIAARI